jgi:hypothetical protein
LRLQRLRRGCVIGSAMEDAFQVMLTRLSRSLARDTCRLRWPKSTPKRPT